MKDLAKKSDISDNLREIENQSFDNWQNIMQMLIKSNIKFHHLFNTSDESSEISSESELFEIKKFSQSKYDDNFTVRIIPSKEFLTVERNKETKQKRTIGAKKVVKIKSRVLDGCESEKKSKEKGSYFETKTKTEEKDSFNKTEAETSEAPNFKVKGKVGKLKEKFGEHFEVIDKTEEKRGFKLNRQFVSYIQPSQLNIDKEIKQRNNKMQSFSFASNRWIPVNKNDLSKDSNDSKDLSSKQSSNLYKSFKHDALNLHK